MTTSFKLYLVAISIIHLVKNVCATAISKWSQRQFNSLLSDICQANWAVWQPKSHLVCQNLHSFTFTC